MTVHRRELWPHPSVRLSEGDTTVAFIFDVAAGSPAYGFIIILKKTKYPQETLLDLRVNAGKEESKRTKVGTYNQIIYIFIFRRYITKYSTLFSFLVRFFGRLTLSSHDWPRVNAA